MRARQHDRRALAALTGGGLPLLSARPAPRYPAACLSGYVDGMERLLSLGVSVHHSTAIPVDDFSGWDHATATLTLPIHADLEDLAWAVDEWCKALILGLDASDVETCGPRLRLVT